MLRSKRSDAGKKRTAATQEPERVTLYLPGHGLGPKIAKAIETDLAKEIKTNPRANASTILMKWITDYLGLKP